MDEAGLLDVVNIWFHKENSEGAPMLLETTDKRFFCVRVPATGGSLRVREVEVTVK